MLRQLRQHHHGTGGPGDRGTGGSGPGDLLVIDTGARYDGYFRDFDRNFTFGAPSTAAVRAYETVYAATEAGLEQARPGTTTSEIWSAMCAVLKAGGALGNDVGRMGHGLGMQLTEWPSNMPGDDTVLEPGMLLPLESGMEFAPGQLMVHEENVVIREQGAEWLSMRASPQMTVIS